MNIADALKHGCITLKNSESPDIDSQLLLCHILICGSNYLHTWPEKELSSEQQQQFDELIIQRQQGKPVAQLTGQRGFWSLDLKVTEDTLIPRPDTELLVSLALEKVTSNMRVADLGTGTGAIGLSLAQEVSNIRVFASDASWQAIEVAKYNAVQHQLSNVQFWNGSWLDAIADKALDMVVSNPPYIKSDDAHLLQGDVRFEPMTALASGADGLEDIRQIIVQAKRCLKPTSWLLIEHGYDQAQQVMTLFTEAGFITVSSHKDYGDNDRVVMGQLPS
ncbi:MAG: peptide chain release factor N(5)-glutamine methyltransferase [Methylophaga sp.]|nr:peptide chain release factor N(5)-glutamine methyltransferase [Methylophaga sp.]